MTQSVSKSSGRTVNGYVKPVLALEAVRRRRHERYDRVVRSPRRGGGTSWRRARQRGCGVERRPARAGPANSPRDGRGDALLEAPQPDFLTWGPKTRQEFLAPPRATVPGIGVRERHGTLGTAVRLEAAARHGDKGSAGVGGGGAVALLPRVWSLSFIATG
jgi:hypothetical protein